MELQRKRQTVRPTGPPDGGYGWFIVLSTFLVFGLTFGVIKSFGVFFVEIHHYFATTVTASSWITSIAVATLHFGAPIGSALSAYFSHRCVVIVGGLLSSIGMVAGSCAQDLIQLYITVGFLTGFGYALTWTPTVTMLGWYFEKRRPVANALASTGECILTFILTPSFQFLVDQFSWRGAMLILGALQLNLCLCGALLRPLDGEVPAKELAAKGKDLELETLSQTYTRKTSANRPGPKQNSELLKNKIIRYVDYTLIANGRFMVYSMFGVFAALGFFAPSLFLVPYARSKGVEEYQAASLMSISSALDLSGRLIFGWVANLRLVKTIHQLFISVILLAVILLLCPLAATFTHLALFSASYGLVFGATVAIHITVLAEVVGVEKLGSALGFFMLIRSSGGLLGPPLAGIFIDEMNDYGVGFLMAGVALIVSALFLLLLHQMNKKGQHKRKDSAMENESRKVDI
nr:monocarboxylate transporter 2 [Misgurnus anguillicaudatus]XP_055029917.1 monocarboxylate transporter 2 [Misgurnus anguillicaudatus]XP_055029918.1 monocarboxylate transporter 2 [Misgurnus anguillicaudatus]XP_055029919.1 monocarboxylate transporter 2 [Misgurnus anguillicaudatus]